MHPSQMEVVKINDCGKASTSKTLSTAEKVTNPYSRSQSIGRRINTTDIPPSIPEDPDFLNAPPIEEEHQQGAVILSKLRFLPVAST
jgi:hypothetical protein